MTCEDFWRFAASDINAASNAERAAMRIHYHSCEACKKRFLTAMIEDLKRLTPEQIAASIAHGTEAALKMCADEECREQIEAANCGQPPGLAADLQWYYRQEGES